MSAEHEQVTPTLETPIRDDESGANVATLRPDEALASNGHGDPGSAQTNTNLPLDIAGPAWYGSLHDDRCAPLDICPHEHMTLNDNLICPGYRVLKDPQGEFVMVATDRTLANTDNSAVSVMQGLEWEKDPDTGEDINNMLTTVDGRLIAIEASIGPDTIAGPACVLQNGSTPQLTWCHASIRKPHSDLALRSFRDSDATTRISELTTLFGL